jgi:hypothetical protein
MKNAVFWHIKNTLTLFLIVILFTLMLEAIYSFETTVATTADGVTSQKI